jgi:hypothetical protein
VDRTILPATVGEDANGAVGVAVVKVRERNREPKPEPKQRNPESSPKLGQDRQISLRSKLLRESHLFKGSQQ